MFFHQLHAVRITRTFVPGFVRLSKTCKLYKNLIHKIRKKLCFIGKKQLIFASIVQYNVRIQFLHI